MKRRKAATANFLFRSLTAALPLLFGILTGHAAAGTAAFLGSYLLLCSFPDLDSRPAPVHLGVAATTLMLAASAGARLAETDWYVIGLVCVVGLQAITHLVHRNLQLAAAMSCLSYLLAPMALDRDVAAAWPLTLLFDIGAVFYGAVLLVPLSAIAGSVRFPMLSSLTAARRQEWFVFSLCLTAVIVLAASRIAGPALSELGLPVGDAEFVLWAVAASLRIPVSDATVLRRRGRQRSIGTVIGSIVVLGLVLVDVSNLGTLLTITAVLMIMQVIGAQRYLWWSTGLTIIAVLVTLDHGGSLELDALARVLATGFGASLAVGLDAIQRRLRVDVNPLYA